MIIDPNTDTEFLETKKSKIIIHMVKVIIICPECGTEYTIKIPFRLRKRVDNIELACDCGIVKARYINKIGKLISDQ